MPRSGDGVWTDIPNITAVPGQTIESADWNNYRADLRDNEFNAARPITAGGTGATNAEDALINLGGVGQSNFLEAFAIGDFYGTVRDISAEGGVWLRRNGDLYNSADYPELAALLPALPDGVTWSNIAVGQTGIEAILAKASGGFIAARYSNPGTGFVSEIYNSVAGESWDIVATLSGDVAISDLAQGAGIYLAADSQGKVFSSNDAISWSPSASTIAGGTSPFTTSLAYGAGLFVATTGNSAGRYIHSSPDGVTWTLRHTVTPAKILNRVRFVNSVFIAVGDDGALITSPDGLTWTSRTTGVTDDMKGITHGNSLYVAVGEGGRIITSTNLTTWTSRTSFTTQSLNEVIYSTAGFITVGNAGTARISGASDGISWATSATGTSQGLTDAIFDPSQQNKYFVVQPGSTSILKGTRTLPTQFQVPDDDEDYGWIKAEDA